MKRFLLVLALVAFVGATYAATAPGSQSAGPSAKQFNALVKQVKTLNKHLKLVAKLSLLEAGVIDDCVFSSTPIVQRGGTANTGYSFTDPNVNGGTPFLTSALDLTSTNDPNALYMTGGNASCPAVLNYARHKVHRLESAVRAGR